MIKEENKTIAIFAHNLENVYSGGRYHAFILAISLVKAGYKVSLVTDNIPVFYNDFECYEELQKLDICLVPLFKQKYLKNIYDIVILIPGMDGYHKGNIYKLALKQKKIYRSKLILLNFESPNWFNQYATNKRPEYLWAGWNFIAQYSDAIISSTKESLNYAERYYGIDSKRHFYCYPAINDKVLNSVPNIHKDKVIICFYRKSHGLHKGGDIIHKLICEEMRGYHLRLFCGADKPSNKEYIKLLESANSHGVIVECVTKVSDFEKFSEYKNATLLLFPSQFEGFGYPPVEALASGTACICYDLPVLRETCGDHLIYAKHGDIEDFKSSIRDFLRSNKKQSKNITKIIQKYSVDAMRKQLDDIVKELDKRPITDREPLTIEDIKFYVKTSFFWKNRITVYSYHYLRKCYTLFFKNNFFNVLGNLRVK